MKIPMRIKARKDYIRFLKSLEVEQVFLSECKASFDRARFVAKSSKQISLSGRTRFGDPDISASGFSVSAAIEVLIGAEKTAEPIGKVQATFFLKFSMMGEKPDHEHIIRFAKTNIKIIIWPFFREFVHNLTARFGIPHVTIPIHAG